MVIGAGIVFVSIAIYRHVVRLPQHCGLLCRPFWVHARSISSTSTTDILFIHDGAERIAPPTHRLIENQRDIETQESFLHGIDTFLHDEGAVCLTIDSDFSPQV